MASAWWIRHGAAPDGIGATLSGIVAGNGSYHMHQAVERYFPGLRPAHQRGLAFWVIGTILAHSACQTSVITALLAFDNILAEST